MPADSTLSVASRVRAVLEHIPRASGDDRFVVAVVGPPASGKSTLASALAAALDGRAAILGQDAFHLDDQILLERGWRQRKGAPHTFDVAAYSAWLSILRTKREGDIAIPVFDRELELSRNAAQIVGAGQDVLITEGNYLLLNDEPWSLLRNHFDLTVMLTETHEEIERRIRQRWVDHGIEAGEIERRLTENDLPNARLVIEGSASADINL